MPRFSFILATKDRTEELRAFLCSLEAQGRQDYELIVVDQNPDDRLEAVLQAFSGLNQVIHLRCEPGLSRARNQGLPIATGDIIAFPDDDCWYPKDLLNNVDHWFEENSGYGIVSVTVRDHSGKRSANRWNEQTCDLAPVNIFRTSASYSFFVRRSVLADGVFFDENLGVGCPTRYGSGEDTDFVLNLMERGVKGAFTSRLYVGHPRRDMYSGHVKVERALSYGLGMGRVLRKHSLFLLAVALFGFDILRTAGSFIRGDVRSARLCWNHSRGILGGMWRDPSCAETRF